MTIKVLYISPFSFFGGPTNSLLQLLEHVENHDIEPYVLVKRGGKASKMFRDKAKTLEAVAFPQWDNSSFGYYKGFRWLILLRELLYLPLGVFALWEASRKWKNIDIVHFNETLMAPLLPFVKFFFDAKIIMHGRTTQQVTSAPLRGKLLMRFLAKYCDTIIAIDETVANTYTDIPIEIIHNSLKPISVDFKILEKRNAEILDGAPLTLAIVGGLVPAKGLFDLIEAVRLCKMDGIQVHLLIVGENVRFAKGVKKFIFDLLGVASDVKIDLIKFISEHNLSDSVQLLGFRSDIEKILYDTDIMCCVTHANAAGRTVFEAGFFGKPSIVTIPASCRDVFIDGISGLKVSSHSPSSIKNAIQMLHEDRNMLISMGKEAKIISTTTHCPKRNAQKIFNLYSTILNKATRKKFI